jgi:hypothetical protein
LHYPERQKEAGSWQSNFCLYSIFIPFVILAVIYLVFALRAISLRNDVTYPEGANVATFLTSLRTGRLYTSPFDPPYNAQIYGPIYYVAGLATAAMVQGSPMAVTVIWRLLTFLSFLGSAGLVGYLSWKLEGRKRWAAVAIILCLACPWSVRNSATVRPDALAIFLIIAALTTYQLARGRTGVIFLAGALASLSCLTKQTMVPALIALLLAPLSVRKFREASVFLAGAVAIAAPILCIFWIRREPFLANFLIMRHAVFDWRSGLMSLSDYLRAEKLAFIPISLAVYGAALKLGQEKYRAVLLFVCLISLSRLVAFANIGSAENYLVLPWFAMALLVPATLVRMEYWARYSILIPLGLSLLSGFLLIHRWGPLPTLPANLDVSKLRQMTILTDLPYLAVRSRKPQLLDPFLYHQFSLNKVWSSAPIVRQIDSEEFDLVLIAGENRQHHSEFLPLAVDGVSFWGHDTLKAMDSHYRSLCEVRSFVALVPRNRSVALNDRDIERLFGEPCRTVTPAVHVVSGGLL